MVLKCVIACYFMGTGIGENCEYSVWYGSVEWSYPYTVLLSLCILYPVSVYGCVSSCFLYYPVGMGVCRG